MQEFKGLRDRICGHSRRGGRASIAVLLAAGMLAAGAVGVDATPAEAARATPRMVAPKARPSLSMGMRDQWVTVLQQKLRMPVVTGYFGPLTLSYVQALQDRARLPRTGVVDRMTWKKADRLKRPLAPGGGAAPAPTSTTAAPKARPSLSMGMRDQWVTVLQQKLRMPVVTGYFGPLTLSYVQALQARARLPRTGVVDRMTWKKADRLKRPLAPGGAPSAGPTPTPTPATAKGRAAKVLAVAARYKGVPYSATGSSPATGFNCSSYTQYVYEQIGVDLGGAYTVWQYDKSRHIRRSKAKPGDLVFFYNYPNNFLGHVGIYAGNNLMWHSPRPGRVVSLDKIYTDKVLFGRVL